MTTSDERHLDERTVTPRATFRRSLQRLMFLTLLVPGSVLVSSPSWAGIIASAVLLSTDAQKLDCFVSNAGTSPVTITRVSIVNGGNTILSLSAANCVGQLSPGGNCVFSAALDLRFSARGLVELRGSAKGLRGQCQLTTSSNHLVATTELR